MSNLQKQEGSSTTGTPSASSAAQNPPPPLSASSSVSTVTELREDARVLREMFLTETLQRRESEDRAKIVTSSYEERPNLELVKNKQNIVTVNNNSSSTSKSPSSSPKPQRVKEKEKQVKITVTPVDASSPSPQNPNRLINNNNNTNNNNSIIKPKKETEDDDYSKFQSGIKDLDATVLANTTNTNNQTLSNTTALSLLDGDNNSSNYAKNNQGRRSSQLHDFNNQSCSVSPSGSLFLTSARLKKTSSASPETLRKLEEFNNTTNRPSLSPTMRDMGPASPLVQSLTTLHFAADWDMAEYMISQGADVNQYDKSNIQQPLHAAAQSGRHDVCVVLLVNHAEVNSLTGDEDKATPLDLAVENLHFEIVSLLQSKGAQRTTRSFSRMLARGIDDVEYKRLKDEYFENKKRMQLLEDEQEENGSPSPQNQQFLLGSVRVASPPKMRKDDNDNDKNKRAGSAPAELKNSKGVTVIDLTKQFKPDLEAARRSSLPLHRRVESMENNSNNKKQRGKRSSTSPPSNNENASASSPPPPANHQNHSGAVTSPDPKNPQGGNSQKTGASNNIAMTGDTNIINKKTSPDNKNKTNATTTTSNAKTPVIYPSNHHNNLEAYHSEITSTSNPFSDGFFDAAHGRKSGPRIIPDHQESEMVLRRKEMMMKKKKQEEQQQKEEAEKQKSKPGINNNKSSNMNNSNRASTPNTTTTTNKRFDSPTALSALRRTNSSNSSLNYNNNSSNAGGGSSSSAKYEHRPWHDSIKVTKGTSAWARSTTPRMPIQVQVAKGIHLPISQVPDRAGGRKSTNEDKMEQERQDQIQKHRQILEKHEAERKKTRSGSAPAKARRGSSDENNVEKLKRRDSLQQRNSSSTTISPLRRPTKNTSYSDGRYATPTYRRDAERIEYVLDKPNSPSEVKKQKELCSRLSTPKRKRTTIHDSDGDHVNIKNSNRRRHEMNNNDDGSSNPQSVGHDDNNGESSSKKYEIESEDGNTDYRNQQQQEGEHHLLTNPRWNCRPYHDLSPSKTAPLDLANEPREESPKKRRERFEREKQELLAEKKLENEMKEREKRERTRMIRDHELEMRMLARNNSSSKGKSESPRNDEEEKHTNDVQNIRPPWNPRNKLDASPSLFSSDHSKQMDIAASSSSKTDKPPASLFLSESTNSSSSPKNTNNDVPNTNNINNNNNNNKPRSPARVLRRNPTPTRVSNQKQTIVNDQNSKRMDQKQSAKNEGNDEINEEEEIVIKSLHPAKTTTTLRGREVVKISFGGSGSKNKTNSPLRQPKKATDQGSNGSRNHTPIRVGAAHYDQQNQQQRHHLQPSPVRRVSSAPKTLSPNLSSRLVLDNSKRRTEENGTGEGNNTVVATGGRNNTPRRVANTQHSSTREGRPVVTVDQVSYLAFGNAPFQPNHLPVQRPSAYYSPKRRTSTPTPLERPKWTSK